MAYTEHTILIQPQAPAKVPEGAPCNGCGVCCLYAPCPLGMLLSRRRTGACAALRWDDAVAQYRCGAIIASQDVLVQSLPKGTGWLAPALAPALRRWGLRWIAAGTGCDSSLEVVRPNTNVSYLAPGDGPSTTIPSSDFSKPTRTRVRQPPP